MELPLPPCSASLAANSVLDRIARIYPTLSRAERQVADFVLADPGGLARTPISRITSQSGASAPTILCFCRAVGFKGLTDLKLSMVAVLGGDARTEASATSDHPLLNSATELVDKLRHLALRAHIAEAAALLAGAAGVTCMASHDLLAAAAYARDALLSRAVHALTPDAPAYGGAPSGPATAHAVGLFFCRGLPTAALADTITRYRRHGHGAIVVGDVTVAPFAQAPVEIATGLPPRRGAAHGSTALLPHLLVTDLLVDALVRRRGAAAGH
ncbi:MurR/RpiR family transcriptional regulator [Massilia sp. TW-1]|uniref:MurR/RpiR family transcriptional regulator n=1 Tax=Telluria antibiotica TaxID=2717319 RepID=A0ABX0P6Q5_9BURK|nr:MurR/RpiR family transcriptional regulator [Telluria antibiotica]NIA52532.1 MurR/RpiR family transcriptional regulator [Telluria antibiotica]